MADAQTNTNSTIAWLALLVAIVALGFSVVAFNRTGTDVSTVIQEQSEKAAESTQVGAARIKAETELATIRTQIAAKKSYEGALQETQEARAELREAYADASIEVRQEWRGIDADFELLESELRDKSADALTVLDHILDRLRADIRTDEK